MPVVSFPLDEQFPNRHEDAQQLLWALGVNGQGCRVAVIDTGADLSRLEDWRSRGCRIHAIDLTRHGEGAGDASSEHHGTRVVERLLTHSPAAEVFSLRVYDKDCRAERDDFVRALEWCAAKRIAIANISTTFYDGCSIADRCPLCTALNTIALTGDLLSVVACGDAYTLNEHIDQKRLPLMCPAWSGLAWGIAANSVVAPRAPLAREAGGLSFTAARMSGALALLRGALPELRLMLLRAVLQRTCMPHGSDTPAGLGFGRHSPVLAYFCAGHLSKSVAGGVVRTQSLAAPSSGRRGEADENVCQALEKVCALLFREDWIAALKHMEMVRERLAGWAPALEQALAAYVHAAILEGLHRTEQAAAGYRDYFAAAQSYWSEAAAVAGRA